MSDIPQTPEPDPGPADEPDDMPDDDEGDDDEDDGTPPAGEQGAQGDADGKPRSA